MRSLPVLQMMNTNCFYKTLCVAGLCFGLATVSGTAAATQDEAAKTSADQVMSDALKGLANYSSIKADLHEAVTMGTRRFTATGSYLQGPNNQLRLSLEIQPIEETAAPTNGKSPTAKKTDEPKGKKNGVVQVSDGRILWTEWILAGKSRVERRDIQEITKALEGSDRWTPQQLVSDMGLGGVPALLTSMKKRMVFNGVREEQIDGKPFVVVQGRWSDAQIQLFRPGNTESDPILDPFLPEYVRIFFEKKTLFPRRIMFLKRHPNPEQRTARPMVTLDLTNVVLNGETDSEQFRFTGSTKDQTDITEQLIDALKQQIVAAEQIKAARQQQQSPPAGR